MLALHFYCHEVGHSYTFRVQISSFKNYLIPSRLYYRALNKFIANKSMINTMKLIIAWEFLSILYTAYLYISLNCVTLYGQNFVCQTISILSMSKCRTILRGIQLSVSFFDISIVHNLLLSVYLFILLLLLHITLWLNIYHRGISFEFKVHTT